MIVGHAFINSNRGSGIKTTEDEATTAYHDYIEGPEEPISDAKEYAENISTAQTDQKTTALSAKLSAERKQIAMALEQIMVMMKAAMTAGGAPPTNNTKRGKTRETTVTTLQ